MMGKESSMKRYRFLLFDADYTLLDFDKDMFHAFQATYEACFGSQRPYSPALLEQYEACNDRWWKKLERGECTKPQLFAGRFQDFLQETGLTGQPEEINRLYFENLAQGGALLPGALELVRDLSGAYQLYIVTNGNAVSQMSRLERSGLLPYVQDVFVSEDAGAAKPDVRYFDYAFSRIPGFEKERALLIGDSLTSDMLGAQNAGIDSMWYCPQALRYYPEWEEEAKKLSITYQVGSFEEMRRVLL